MKTSAILATIIAGLASPATAQWLYEGEDSAFGGGGTHMAITGNASYAFALRCENGEAVAVYVTPEQIEQSDADKMSGLKPKMLLRVDEQPVVETETTLESTNGVLRATSPTDANFADQVRTAKKRIAVALTLGGQTFHEQKFQARGSTSAVGKVMTACKLAN